ncbi:MAG TPA: glycosyltransferase family A protein [Acidobacteriaceae bacterium]|nr:glycosyltransferase family A protein [Acidobacteriaceae bacterium]
MDDAPPLTLSVIIPARNEDDCLGDCLWSLVRQQEPGWELPPHHAEGGRVGDPGVGTDWEIIVVNDASTDGTRQVAESFAGVTVMDAPKLEKGWTGKANAVWAASQAARGTWLLFTDADTVHEPGGLRRAIIEAERHGVGMLSYSARQIVRGLAQRAVMPMIFADLAATYPPAKVNDPKTRTAAANGQFLLVRRDAYEKIGGHKAVHGAVLEDVELAVLAKRRGVGLRLRYAPEAVATRMYRSFGAMWQGWTKNLALLFGNAPALAGMRLLQLAVLVGIPALMALLAWGLGGEHGIALHAGILGAPMAIAALGVVWLRALWGFYSRVAMSNFPLRDYVWAPLGIPLYAAMLWRSWFLHNVVRQVVWKGREIRAGDRR